MNATVPRIEQKKILLVDDDLLFLHSLARSLRNEAGITTVTTAEDALSEMECSTFDLCFLDNRLPGMSGLCALPLIRRRWPQTMVVLMTAGDLDARDRDTVEGLAHRFLEKPFDLSDVLRLVRTLLEMPLPANPALTCPSDTSGHRK